MVRKLGQLPITFSTAYHHRCLYCKLQIRCLHQYMIHHALLQHFWIWSLPKSQFHKSLYILKIPRYSIRSQLLRGLWCIIIKWNSLHAISWGKFLIYIKYYLPGHPNRLHCFSSLVSPEQFSPPFWASVFIVLCLNSVPPPQVTSHVFQSPNSPHSQSTRIRNVTWNFKWKF